MPLVDIAITTKNNEQGLLQLLTALYYQTFKDFRIVINDESDNSIMLNQNIVRTLDLFAIQDRPYIKYNRNLHSKGTPWAEYLVFNMCDSKYIWVIDDDNIPEANALSLLVDVLDNSVQPWVQGCFGDITNSRSHINFDNSIKSIKAKNLFYYYRYAKDTTRKIPHGEGGNLLYRRAALLNTETSYYNKDFIENYGNNSGIHIVISSILSENTDCYLRTGSVVYHLERVNPRFSFKAKRNLIMLSKLKPFLNDEKYNSMEEIFNFNME